MEAERASASLVLVELVVAAEAVLVGVVEEAAPVEEAVVGEVAAVEEPALPAVLMELVAAVALLTAALASELTEVSSGPRPAVTEPKMDDSSTWTDVGSAVRKAGVEPARMADAYCDPSEMAAAGSASTDDTEAATAGSLLSRSAGSWMEWVLHTFGQRPVLSTTGSSRRVLCRTWCWRG